MEHLFRGEVLSGKITEHHLNRLRDNLVNDLVREPISTERVISAVNQLIASIQPEEMEDILIKNGMAKWKAKSLVITMLERFTEEELWKKVQRELGTEPFRWQVVEGDIYEKDQPYGVLMHIGAGNVVALSVMSIIDGLLSGNINILKLPSYEGGISIQLLQQLIEIEPAFKPYIYVFDIASHEQKLLSEIASLADAVVVWGSDEAIAGIRQLAPPHLPIIEWGHRMSFAFFTANDNLEEDLKGLATEICLSDQEYCSSPQCVFYETEDNDQLKAFAEMLTRQMEVISKKYPVKERPLQVEAEITWTKELLKMESILGDKSLISNDDWGFNIMIDYEPELKASPLHRNIWVMPIQRNSLMAILRPHKGHLQTVGLSCDRKDREALSQIFYGAGVNRLTTCRNMSSTYSGEPHDGFYTLRKYVRRVSKNL